MTRVKICGITNLDDALAAVEAGADALGFVFAASPRRIEPAQAAAIAERLPPFVVRAGVFVDAPAEELRAVARAVPLDVIQLHGDEPRTLTRVLGLRVVRRIRVRDDDTRERLRERLAGHEAAAFLLDPGSGSGRTFRWEIARELGVRVVVAGGLTPANVGAAIRAARPYAVDVCSGVERRPGAKDPAALRAFVAAVREEDDRHTA